jgi:hypothetical protein
MAKALSPSLSLEDDDDPRIQIYRTSMDSFLSWLSLVASGLNRKLFSVADIEEVGYWVTKIQSEQIVQGFIVAYGYEERFMTLVNAFRKRRNPYRSWYFINPHTTRILREALQSCRPQPQESNSKDRPRNDGASPSQTQEAGSKTSHKFSSET